MTEPNTSISIGDTIQCIEDNWQGRVTGFEKYNDVTMLVCHHWSGAVVELDDKRWFDPRDVRLLRKATFVAYLHQFIRPYGHKKTVETDLPIDVEPLYKDMQAHGCRLECEVLLTGEVSVTVSDDGADHDFSVTPNGPAVQPGIAAMLRRRSWLRLSLQDESV